MHVQVSKNDLTFIVFNLKPCQKNKKLRQEEVVLATTVRLNLALAWPRLELLQPEPDLGFGKKVSKLQ